MLVFRLPDSEQTGEAYVLEVNPNPYLEKQSELAMAAADRGMSYTQLIERIVDRQPPGTSWAQGAVRTWQGSEPISVPTT